MLIFVQHIFSNRPYVEMNAIMKAPCHRAMKVTEVVLFSHLPTVVPVVQEFTKTFFSLRHFHAELLTTCSGLYIMSWHCAVWPGSSALSSTLDEESRATRWRNIEIAVSVLDCAVDVRADQSKQTSGSRATSKQLVYLHPVDKWAIG